ncbi:FecR domain-containing protein [Variovorax sp. PCZ-1]|uniref:FecR domain-containing protein n=1 Tax=Variovorax sp. PCZ-1 TaxID=2835533 RepID=UPI001BCDE52F|nr:FecR domain-containing protein [Variovorax sp. PCZ-1]MBS7808465.1 FecR domain-containing protein [Variovorax sp. PCZ-1]
MSKLLSPRILPARKATLFVATVIASSLHTHVWAAIDKHTEPFISYTVKKGDTLQGLSRNLLANPQRWNELARLNGLKNPNLIQPDFVIDVPRSFINFANQPKLATSGVLQSANGSVTINGAPAQTGAAVPEGARVQTASGSSAVVKMSDGTSVQLMPRSLAEVTTQHGYAMKDPASSISTTWFSGAIRLVEGVLDIAANKLAQRKEPLNVVTPTSVVGVRGTQFRVAYEDPASRSARTEVLEGKVRADNPTQGAGADVGGGFGVAVKPTEREIKVVALLPALPESALPARVERAREGQQASWTVGTLSGAAGYRAELAQDPAFTQIVFDTKSVSPVINLAAAPNGNYFARVRGVDASGIEGYNAVRRIDIANAAVALIWIREVNVAATADLVPEGVLLRANISAVDTPRNLQIQIAQDAAMTQGLQTLPLDATGNVILKDLKASERRYVRFTGTSPQGAVGNSPVLLLELPPNWGQTVFSVTSALQQIR